MVDKSLLIVLQIIAKLSKNKKFTLAKLNCACMLQKIQVSLKLPLFAFNIYKPIVNFCKVNY